MLWDGKGKSMPVEENTIVDYLKILEIVIDEAIS